MGVIGDERGSAAGRHDFGTKPSARHCAHALISSSFSNPIGLRISFGIGPSEDRKTGTDRFPGLGNSQIDSLHDAPGVGGGTGGPSERL